MAGAFASEPRSASGLPGQDARRSCAAPTGDDFGLRAGGAGWGGPGLLIAKALTLGLLNSFDTPLRQSLIGSFVRRRDGYHPSRLLRIYIYGYRLRKVPTRERIRVSSPLHVTDESNTFGVGAQNDIDFPLDQRFVGKRFIIDQA